MYVKADSGPLIHAAIKEWNPLNYNILMKLPRREIVDFTADDCGQANSNTSASRITNAVVLNINWTVRDFYTLGEEFTYVALVQKVDKKSKRLKFDNGNHLHNCMSPY